jgi:hypothetical protein
MRDDLLLTAGRGTADARLRQRLEAAIEGEVAFDIGTRGRYATDASIYQIMPAGVVFPRTDDDVAATLAIAGEEGTPVIARGGGTSQNGQPIGAGLVIDFSRHLHGILAYDPDARHVRVRPGTVLQRLNARLRRDGLFFPVEPSTASRCTIGGMTGNNSSGARSIHYGKMSDNVTRVAALLADGTPFAFGRPDRAGAAISGDRAAVIAGETVRVARREAAESSRPCRVTGCWASATSRASGRPWRRRGISSRSARWRSSSSTTTCWCSARRSRQWPARSPASPAARPIACCSSSSPATTPRARGPASGSRRLHGRPRLPRRGA